jgi:hypothetical protein
LLTGIPDYFQFLTGGRRCCLAMITALDLRHKTKGSAVFGKYNQSFSLKSVPQQHCAVARPIEIELLWRAGGLHALILAPNLSWKGDSWRKIANYSAPG